MGILKKNKNNGSETQTGEQTETKERPAEEGAVRKKHPLRIVLPLLLLIACTAGVCYTFFVHPQLKTKIPAMAETLFRKEGTQETGDVSTVKNDLTADETGNMQSQPQEKAEEVQTEEQPQQAEQSQPDQFQADQSEEASDDGEDGAVLEGLSILGEKADGIGTESKAETSGAGESLEIIPAGADEETFCGADGPILDYADEKVIVFHDYYGLFVYDRQSAGMSGTVDLEAIGCQYTQGDSFCDVIVEKGAETIYLHPLDSDDMYVYLPEAHTLTKEHYAQAVLKKRQDLQLTEEMTWQDPDVLRSVQCAVLEDGACLYLESGSGMAADLLYVVEEDGERRSSGYLFDLRTGTDTLWAEESAEAVSEMLLEKESGEEELREAEDGGLDAQAGEDDLPDKEAVVVSDYSEEAFRELCRQIDYRKLMREQETYSGCAVTVELTVLEQIDGGLFDDHIYYLCMTQDSRGFDRYYVIRDDRGEDAALILEGDVLQIYGLFFDTCRCPAQYTAVDMEIPALAMAYCDLQEEF